MLRSREPGVRSAKLPSVAPTSMLAGDLPLYKIFTAADDIPQQLWSKIFQTALQPDRCGCRVLRTLVQVSQVAHSAVSAACAVMNSRCCRGSCSKLSYAGKDLLIQLSTVCRSFAQAVPGALLGCEFLDLIELETRMCPAVQRMYTPSSFDTQLLLQCAPLVRCLHFGDLQCSAEALQHLWLRPATSQR